MNSFKRLLWKKIIIALIGITVVSLVIIALNIDINKRIARIKVHRQELANQDQGIFVLSELRKQSLLAQERMKTLSTLLPSRDELISFPRELETLAKKNTIDLGFSFGSEVERIDGQPGIIRFTMSLGGSTERLLAFLSDVEAHRYFINFASVELTKRENNRFALVTSGEIFTR